MPKSRVKRAEQPVQHKRNVLSLLISRGEYDRARDVANRLKYSGFPDDKINAMIGTGVLHRSYEVSKRSDMHYDLKKNISSSMLSFYNQLVNGEASYESAISILEGIEEDYLSR